MSHEVSGGRTAQLVQQLHLRAKFMRNLPTLTDMADDVVMNDSSAEAIATLLEQAAAALASSSSVPSQEARDAGSVVRDESGGVAGYRQHSARLADAPREGAADSDGSSHGAVGQAVGASSSSVPPASWVAIVAVLKAANDADLPCGEVVLEEDGEICMDWHITSRQTLSVSVRADGRMGWAALVGDKSEHQTCTEVTPELAEVFRQLGQTEAAALPPAAESSSVPPAVQESNILQVAHLDLAQARSAIKSKTADYEWMKAKYNQTLDELSALRAALPPAAGIPVEAIREKVELFRSFKRYLDDHAKHEPAAAEQAHVWGRAADELDALLARFTKEKA